MTRPRTRSASRAAACNCSGSTCRFCRSSRSEPATTARGTSGWLVPDVSISSRNGLELAFPYYRRFAPNRDLTVTPHLFTGSLPAIEARYRHLNRIGAFQLGGFLTHSKIDDADDDVSTSGGSRRERGFRAYVEGNGRAQLDPLWSITSAFRVASDKTVTRRYDITRDDRPAQLRQCRADRPRQLRQHRRLGVPGAARRRRTGADPDRLAGDRRPLAAW
jgi:lipopolysaccharide assembly outer membrane protein LptD (OstA)